MEKVFVAMGELRGLKSLRGDPEMVVTLGETRCASAVRVADLRKCSPDQ